MNQSKRRLQPSNRWPPGPVCCSTTSIRINKNDRAGQCCCFHRARCHGVPNGGYLAAKDMCKVFIALKLERNDGLQSIMGRPSDPRGGCRWSDYVMTCVGNDEDLESVVFGRDGVFAGMKKGRR